MLPRKKITRKLNKIKNRRYSFVTAVAVLVGKK